MQKLKTVDYSATKEIQHEQILKQMESIYSKFAAKSFFK